MSKEHYKINEDKLVWRKSGDNVVILSTANGHYFALNNSASYIWDLLIQGVTSPEEIAFKVAEKFDVTESESKADILKLFNELLKSNLVRSSKKKDD